MCRYHSYSGESLSRKCLNLTPFFPFLSEPSHSENIQNKYSLKIFYPALPFWANTSHSETFKFVNIPSLESITTSD